MHAFRYWVGCSEPPTQVIFFNYREPIIERNETEVTVIMQKAWREATNPLEKHYSFLDEPRYQWDEGEVYLSLEPFDVQPAEEPPPQEVGLTWGIMMYTLVGLNRFRLRYPGLAFSFNIAVEQGGYDEFVTAYGRLSKSSDQAQCGISSY